MPFWISLWAALLRIPSQVIKNLSGAAKDTTGIVKDVTGVRKDLVDTELANKKLAEYESRITPATIDDVKRYDSRTRKILEAADDFARRHLPYVDQNLVLFRRTFTLKITFAIVGPPLLVILWFIKPVPLTTKIVSTLVWILMCWQILIMLTVGLVSKLHEKLIKPR